MSMGFRQRQAELRDKAQWAPRGRRRQEVLKELRELVQRELVLELRSQEAVVPVVPSQPEPPPDLFERGGDAPPAPPASIEPPADDEREPWWHR